MRSLSQAPGDRPVTVEPLEDDFSRIRKDCPHCGGEDAVIEPRSSEWWNCSQCARRFEYDELAWE